MSCPNRPLARLVVIVALTVSPALASQPPEYREVLETYAISGRSVDELRQSIVRNGPAGADASRQTVARATPQFGWKWQVAAMPGSCRIASVSVTLTQTIIMPQWTDKSMAPAALQAEWDRYAADVLAHERGHAAISLATARRIDAAIRALPAWPTCPELRATIRPTVEAIVRQHDAEQQAFDRKEGSCGLRGSCLRPVGPGAVATSPTPGVVPPVTPSPTPGSSVTEPRRRAIVVVPVPGPPRIDTVTDTEQPQAD